MDKLKIKEVIVVEGRSDTKRLQEIFVVDTIETVGSAINQQKIAEIKQAQKVRGVIVLTDPDFAGEKIRKTIMKYVPEVRHAFLKKSEAVPCSRSKGKSLGVEHASAVAIKEALSQVVTPELEDYESSITRSMLSELNLLDGAGSRKLRQIVSEDLRIGTTNGKQLLKRLKMFRISEEQLRQAVQFAEKKVEKINDGENC